MTFFHFVRDFILSAIASAAFAVLFNAPRREIIYTAFAGGIGWILYIGFFRVFEMEMFGAFIGSVIVAYISRVLSYRRLVPSTIYLAPALIPLVPGTEMYYIADGLLRNDMYYTFAHTVRAIKFAGAIAIAILIVYSIPSRYFYMFKKRN